MKHYIDFQVSIDRLSQMRNDSEIIRVGFDSDNSGDTLMNQAFRALERELGNIPDLIEYDIDYWWWVNDDK